MRDRAARAIRCGEDLRTAPGAPRPRGGGACLGLALAAAVLAPVCREDPPAAEAARPDEQGRTTAEEAPPGALASCPSFVEASTTEVGEIPGGVVVTVRAERPGAVEEIRARSRLLALLGVYGRDDAATDLCPVVAQRTTVHAQEIEGGVTILVLPHEAAQVDWLRQETQGRLRGLLTIHGEQGAR
jgi:hypothetical protein